MQVPAVGDNKAVSCRIHCAQPPAGKESDISSRRTGIRSLSANGIADEATQTALGL